MVPDEEDFVAVPPGEEREMSLNWHEQLKHVWLPTPGVYWLWVVLRQCPRPLPPDACPDAARCRLTAFHGMFASNALRVVVPK
ncbi:MAG: hypothetical protein HY898_22260 [Deltaproteobacteria bacterium]|nr:hypothetical protein [Deltaproteobacteria bacterium]